MPHRPRSFYARDARAVARDLLGDRLVHRVDGQALAGGIVETEAYLGPEDPASHARHGRTDRAAIMWDRPGRVYVYRIYGMHDMLNFVADAKGRASAVLVRAVEPGTGLEAMRERRGVEDDATLTDGPAKLCEAFGISLAHRGVDATRDDAPIRVEPGPGPPEVLETGRIGVVEDVDEPRRFVAADSPWASR